MDRVQVAQPTNRVTGWVDKSRHFLAGVRDELKKVTWPTREELIKATRMIVILSIVLGITIGLMDYLLQLILVEGIARLAR
ncbi:MAG: preprotein translocase subunit SecE [Gemmatimonadota bacterium]|nr:preprotein translocase subunit SecE [Gemmatimonadota bacterium]